MGHCLLNKACLATQWAVVHVLLKALVIWESPTTVRKWGPSMLVALAADVPLHRCHIARPKDPPHQYAEVGMLVCPLRDKHAKNGSNSCCCLSKSHMQPTSYTPHRIGFFIEHITPKVHPSAQLMALPDFVSAF
jgi:hypothetical protein